MSGNPAKPALGPSVRKSKRSASTSIGTDHPASAKRHNSWEPKKDVKQDKPTQCVPRKLHGLATSTNGQPAAASASLGLHGQSPQGAKKAGLLTGSNSKPSHLSKPPVLPHAQKPRQPGATCAPAARPQRKAGIAAKRSLASLAAAERNRGCLKAARIATPGLPANKTDAHTPQVPARTIIQASTSTAVVANPELLHANSNNGMHNIQGGTADAHNCLQITSAKQLLSQQHLPQQHVAMHPTDVPIGSRSNALAAAAFQFHPGLPLVQQLSPNQLACCITPSRATTAGGVQWHIPANIVQTFFAHTGPPTAPGMVKCHFSITQADGSGALTVSLSCYLRPHHKQPAYHLFGLTQYIKRHRLQAGDLVLITRSPDEAEFTISHQRSQCTDGSGHSLYDHHDIDVFLQSIHSRPTPNTNLISSDRMTWCISPSRQPACAVTKYNLSTVFRDLHSQLPKTPGGKHCSITLTEQDGSRMHAAIACYKSGPFKKPIYRLIGLPKYQRKHGLQARDVITITRTAPKKFSIAHKLKSTIAPPPGNATPQPTPPPSKARSQDQQRPPPGLARSPYKTQTGRANTGQTHASRTQATAAMPGRQSGQATQPASSPMIDLMPSAQRTHILSDTAAHADGSGNLLSGFRILLHDSAPNQISDPQRSMTMLEQQAAAPALCNEHRGTAQAELATSTPPQVDTNMIHAANLLIHNTVYKPTLSVNPSMAAVQEDRPWSYPAACKAVSPPDGSAQPAQHAVTDQQQLNAVCPQLADTGGPKVNLNDMVIKAEPAANTANIQPDVLCNDTQMGDTRQGAQVNSQRNAMVSIQAMTLAGQNHRHAANTGQAYQPSSHANVICIDMSDEDDAADHGRCGPSARLPAHHYGTALAEQPAPSGYHDAAKRPANMASVKTSEDTGGDCAADMPAAYAPVALQNAVTGHRAQSMPIQFPKLDIELLLTSPTSAAANGKAVQPLTACPHVPEPVEPVAAAGPSGSPPTATAPAAQDSTVLEHNELPVPIERRMPDSAALSPGLAKTEAATGPTINGVVSDEHAAVGTKAQHGVPALLAAGGESESWEPRANTGPMTQPAHNAEHQAAVITTVTQDHAPSLQVAAASTQVPSATRPAASAAAPSSAPLLPHGNSLMAQAFEDSPQAGPAGCRYSSDAPVAKDGTVLPSLTVPAAPPVHAAGIVTTTDGVAPRVTPALPGRQTVTPALAAAPAAPMSAPIATSCAPMANLPPAMASGSLSRCDQLFLQPESTEAATSSRVHPPYLAMPNLVAQNLAAASSMPQLTVQQAAYETAPILQAPPMAQHTQPCHSIGQPAFVPDVSGLSGAARQRALEQGLKTALDAVKADEATRQRVGNSFCKLSGDVAGLKAFVDWQYPYILTSYEAKDIHRLQLCLNSIFNLADA